MNRAHCPQPARANSLKVNDATAADDTVQPATDNIMPRAVIALTLGRTRRVLLKPV